MLGCHDLEGTRYGGSNGKEVFDFNVTVNRLKVFYQIQGIQIKPLLNRTGHRRRGLHASGVIPGHGGQGTEVLQPPR